MTEHLLASERVEQTLHGFFDLINEFVDDGVELHLHAFTFRGGERLVLHFDIEADDDGVGGTGKQHVGLINGADLLMQDVEVALVGLDVGETFGNGFNGTLHIAFQDELECLLVAFLDAGKEMLKRGTTRHIELLLAQFFNALFAKPFDIAFAAHDDDFIADVRHVAEADDLARHAGKDFLDGFATIVDQRFDLAPMRAADEGLADGERALTNDDGGDGTFAGHHGGFNDGGTRRGLRIGLEFEHLGLEGHGFEQVVESESTAGRDFHALDLATPVHGSKADVLQLALHPHDVRGRKITLVDSNHELDTRSFGMTERFFRLRHDAVVCSDDENDDVGDIGTTGTHGRESGVTGGVDESDRLAVVEDAVGTDVLRDTASFTSGHRGLTQGVKQRGLTVIDVTHEGDDRSAQLAGILFIRRRFGEPIRHVDDFIRLVDATAFLTLVALELEAVLLTDFLGDFDIDCLVRAGKDFEGNEFGNDLEGLEAHLVRQILDHDGWLQMDDFFTAFANLKVGRRHV